MADSETLSPEEAKKLLQKMLADGLLEETDVAVAVEENRASFTPEEQDHLDKAQELVESLNLIQATLNQSVKKPLKKAYNDIIGNVTKCVTVYTEEMKADIIKDIFKDTESMSNPRVAAAIRGITKAKQQDSWHREVMIKLGFTESKVKPINRPNSKAEIKMWHKPSEYNPLTEPDS